MDKPRDVRRGASRFSTARLRIKQSAHKLFGGLNGIGGDFEFSEKSKKGKVRSLSAVGRALSSYQDCEMGCDVTEKVDGLPAQSPSSSIIPTSKRFKIREKFFDDCNGVDHASVPRRLRSAMKKRNCEYGLVDSEKVNHKLNGIESPEKNGIKKTKKQGSPDWSTRQTVSVPITKDEEEVVETLFALAGMFPNNGSNDIDSSKLEGDSLPKNSVLQDLGNTTNAAFEASEIAQETNPSCAEGSSPREAAKTNSLNEAIGQKQSDLLDNAQFSLASDGLDPKLDLQTMPTLGRSENGNEVAMKDSGLRLAMGLDMPSQSPILHMERKPEMTVETAVAVECEQEHHMIKDHNKNDGPTLWPDLSLAASTGSHASYLQSSASKAPVWLDAAICASKQDLMHRVSFGGKISKVIHKKSWKRCAAHVHISNLIRTLQVPSSKDTLLQQPNRIDQLRANEGSTHGVVMGVQNSNRVRSEITSASGTVHSDSVKDSHETKNSILQQPSRYLDLPPEAPSPDQYGPQKQSFDILSLSAGLKVNNNRFDKGGGGSRLEPLSTLQMPYFQPLAQQHGLMRVPMPQSQYASTAYLDQLSVAGPQVVPQYYGNPIWGSGNSLTTSNKQQHQNFWAVQVGGEGQGRSGVNCNVMRTQYPNWESGRQAMVPHSPSSLQVVRSKFSPMSISISEQQQQQLIALASSSTSRTNGLDFHLPSSLCDQSRGSRFSASSGTPSLQLLCDDRI